MDNELIRWLWLGMAVLLGIGEVVTAGFFLLPFVIGAGAAAILAWLNVSPSGSVAGVFRGLPAGLGLPAQVYQETGLQQRTATGGRQPMEGRQRTGPGRNRSDQRTRDGPNLRRRVEGHRRTRQGEHPPWQHHRGDQGGRNQAGSSSHVLKHLHMQYVHSKELERK